MYTNPHTGNGKEKSHQGKYKSVCVELFILDSNQTGGGRILLQNVIVDPLEENLI